MDKLKEYPKTEMEKLSLRIRGSIRDYLPRDVYDKVVCSLLKMEIYHTEAMQRKGLDVSNDMARVFFGMPNK